MSRVTDPSSWSPSCWAVFVLAKVALTAVALFYTFGTP